MSWLTALYRQLWPAWGLGPDPRTWARYARVLYRRRRQYGPNPTRWTVPAYVNGVGFWLVTVYALWWPAHRLLWLSGALWLVHIGLMVRERVRRAQVTFDGIITPEVAVKMAFDNPANGGPGLLPAYGPAHITHVPTPDRGAFWLGLGNGMELATDREARERSDYELVKEKLAAMNRHPAGKDRP